MPVPAAAGDVTVHLLGASTESARYAARLGVAFAYAHHISPGGAAAALRAYRDEFVPGVQARPSAILAARVVAAETTPLAHHLALPSVLGQLRARTTGRLDPFPVDVHPDEVAALRGAWREFVADRLAGHVLGTPTEVASRLVDLVDATGADELMALTMVPAGSDRARSYELLAEAARIAAS